MTLLMGIAALLLFTLLTTAESSWAHAKPEPRIKTEVFLSPKFTLQPGLVSDKTYYNIDFPRGHIAIKSFNGEVVDGHGNPIPLHETYLHHWVVLRYYKRKGATFTNTTNNDVIKIKNDGVCDNSLSQYFGIGSETRRTSTDIPNPYGIEVGGGDVPEGYEDMWALNVHAIDTRGAEEYNRMGCSECRCDLYNATVDHHGFPLPEGYGGGLRCCYDGSRCRVKLRFDESEEAMQRDLYLRYTVKYVDWEDWIVPVRIFILDVTDLWTDGDEFRGTRARHNCLVEYDVDPHPEGEGIHTRVLKVSFPMINGDVIYGVGHQHAGGTGTALYGEDGREICSSYPIYGKGYEAGNESGYIVGMTTCYPSPGSVKISPGERLTLVSNYSSSEGHTGVMGLIYLLVAEPSAYPEEGLWHRAAHDVAAKVNVGYWAVGSFGFVVLVGVGLFVALRARRERPEGYEPVA